MSNCGKYPHEGPIINDATPLMLELKRQNGVLRSELKKYVINILDELGFAQKLAEANSKIAELELENAALRKDKERLDWLERFLQMGGASVFSSPTCEAHKDRPDDTEETRWNHPFHIGYDVELGHRGCYKWRELSNGAKGIRPAIDAARKEESK